jgi:hypothetical protein
MIDEITLLVEPQRGEDFIPPEHRHVMETARQFYECDRFADHLRQQVKARVTVREDFLYHLPPQTFSPGKYVLLYASTTPWLSLSECELQMKAVPLDEIVASVVPLGVGRKDMERLLRDYPVPVAVDDNQYFRWLLAEEPNNLPYSVYGLAHLSRALQARKYKTNLPGLQGDRYAILNSRRSQGLGGFLVRYLQEYDENRYEVEPLGIVL